MNVHALAGESLLYINGDYLAAYWQKQNNHVRQDPATVWHAICLPREAHLLLTLPSRTSFAGAVQIRSALAVARGF